MVEAADEDVSAEVFGAGFEEEAGFGSNTSEGGGGRDLWCKRIGRAGVLVKYIC